MFATPLLQDLAARWRRSRRAAATAITGPVAESAPEDELLHCASEVDLAGLHRALFENGVRLGEGFRRTHRTVGLAELPETLAALGSPCLGPAAWTAAGEGAWKLERLPCAATCPAATCDAWRESIDGLVLGLTGGARHTRTSSRGHGQHVCVDVLYEDAESPLRHGELDDALIPTLESVQRFVRLFKGADVRFLGVSEGVLLYQLDTSGCDSTRDTARSLIERMLEKKLPHLRVRELSPRAVLDPTQGAAP